MNPPEGERPPGQREDINGNIARERQLQQEDPVRRDILNQLLQARKTDNPDLPVPNNIGELLSSIEETIRRLPETQRRGAERLFPQLGQGDLSPEQQERLLDQLLQAHFLRRINEAVQGGGDQPIVYPVAEQPPPRHAAPINHEDLLRRRLLEGLSGGLGREVEYDPETEELIEFSQPPYPEIKIPVKKDKGELMTWMQQILNNAERSERESYGAEINAGEIQKIALVMRALREKSRREKNEVNAKGYWDKAEAMREEYEARLYLHEYFVQFRRPEDAERMFDNGQMLRSRYFQLIFSKPEVRRAFLLHKQLAVEYLKARGENRTKPEDRGRVPKTREDIRFEIRMAAARQILPDEWAKKLFNVQQYRNLNDEQKSQIDSRVSEELNRFEKDEHGEEELFQKFGWAQNLAERIWRFSGMAAVQDRLSGREFKNGQVVKSGSFLDSANNGDLLMQRAVNVINMFFGAKDAFNFWPKLLEGVDFGNQDFFSFILGEIVKNERRRIEEGVKQSRTDLSGDDLKEEVEQQLKDHIKEKFDYELVRDKDEHNREIRAKSYRPLNAGDADIVAFDSADGHQLYQLADRMSEKTLEETFSYDWDSFSDTAIRGWQWASLINIDKLRGSQLAAGRDKEAFLITPNAETLSKFVAMLAYRAVDQPKIRTRLTQNLWTYMAHERKAHKGGWNAFWDELETMLTQAVDLDVVTLRQAREAMRKAVKNDLKILYKDFEKYFSIWEFLLQLIWGIAKEGFKPVQV